MSFYELYQSSIIWFTYSPSLTICALSVSSISFKSSCNFCCWRFNLAWGLELSIALGLLPIFLLALLTASDFLSISFFERALDFSFLQILLAFGMLLKIATPTSACFNAPTSFVPKIMNYVFICKNRILIKF